MNLQKRFLVLGLGHPLLADDTLGLRLADEAARRFSPLFPDVDFRTHPGGSFDLLPLLGEYARVLVLDSICTGQSPAGTCHEFRGTSAAGTAAGWVSPHGLNWPQLFALARAWGFTFPDELRFFAVEARNFDCFAEEPSAEIRRSFPLILEKIRRQLETWCTEPRGSRPYPEAEAHEIQFE